LRRAVRGAANNSENTIKQLQRLPPNYAEFHHVVQSPYFSKDIAIVIQPKKDNSSNYALSTTNYGYSILTKPELNELLRRRVVAQGTSIHKMSLDNFWYSSVDLTQDGNLHFDEFQNMHQFKMVEKSTPKGGKTSAHEHYIKLMLYCSLRKTLCEMLPDTLLLLAGSLGKGLPKVGSDLDLVFMSSKLIRCKNSYSHFPAWWNAIGREASLDELSRINKMDLKNKLACEQDLLVLDDYNFIDNAKVPIINFNFGEIPVDLQYNNFLPIDEAALQRYLIHASNPALKDVNVKLVNWARRMGCVGSGGLDLNLKPFHFTSFMLFYAMKENYIPTPKFCMDQNKFMERGNVVIDYKTASKQASNCKPITSENDQNEFLKNMAKFYQKHNFSHSLNLFNGETTTFNDSTAVYSQKNMVSNAEMTTLFRGSFSNNELGETVTAVDVAMKIKRSWADLHQEMCDKTEVRKGMVEEVKAKQDKAKHREGDFDFDF